MSNVPQETLKNKDHYKLFRRTVSLWKSVLFPVSTREMSFNNLSIASYLDDLDWSSFGNERREKIKMI